MSDEIELADKFDRMNSVVEELLKGSNPTQISKQLGMKRVEVLESLQTWRGLIQSDQGIRERAKEALAGADQHYAMLIKRAWETVEQADMNNQLNIKASSLKLIADIESKRIDMLQKAGLLEDNEMAEKILDNERKQEILTGILRDVTSKCNHCKVEVARRLGQVTNKVEVVIVDEA